MISKTILLELRDTLYTVCFYKIRVLLLSGVKLTAHHLMTIIFKSAVLVNDVAVNNVEELSMTDVEGTDAEKSHIHYKSVHMHGLPRHPRTSMGTADCV